MCANFPPNKEHRTVDLCRAIPIATNKNIKPKERLKDFAFRRRMTVIQHDTEVDHAASVIPVPASGFWVERVSQGLIDFGETVIDQASCFECVLQVTSVVFKCYLPVVEKVRECPGCFWPGFQEVFCWILRVCGVERPVAGQGGIRLQDEQR